MGYIDWELLVVIVLLSGIVGWGLVWFVPRMWRERADRPPAKPRRWTFRRAMQPSFVRTWALNYFQMAALDLGLIALFLERLFTGAPSRVAGTVATTFGFVFGALLLVWPVVSLFNRPRFLVPPDLRNDRGALELWWLSRKGPVAEARDAD
jgi:hypothetical protein